MGRLKGLLAIISLCLVMAFGASFCQAAENGAMTNAEFADVLFRALQLNAPEGFNEMSDAQAYEAQANMLAERGIGLFKTVKPSDLVTRGNLCSVLSSSIERVPEDMGVEMVETRGTTSSLFNNTLFGYKGQRSVDEMSKTVLGLGCPAGNDSDVMEFSAVIEALNVPALSLAVAEAYTAPGETPGGRRGIGPQPGIGFQVPAQNPIPEDLQDTVFASPTTAP